jgi:hypothetical protein
MTRAWQSGLDTGKHDSQSGQHVTMSVCAKKFHSDYVSTDSAVVTQSPALLRNYTRNVTEQAVFPNAFYHIFSLYRLFSFIVPRNSLFIINLFVLLFMTPLFSDNAVTG